MNYLEIVKFLIEMENIDVNEREYYNGNTPLITASSIKNEKIALLLISNAKTDINASNYSMKTALTYTSLNGMISIASALVTHPNFDPYSSNLNFAFYSSSVDMITSLLYPIKDLDVNYQIIHDGSKISGFDFSLWNSHSYKFYLSAIDTSLTKAVQENKFQKVEMIIKHPSFNESKSNIKETLSFSIQLTDNSIFKLLYQSFNDYKIIFHNGKNLLEHLLDANNHSIWQWLLLSSNIELSKDDFLMLYRKSSQNELLVSLLSEYDEKHNHCIDFNEPLTSITFIS